MVALLGALALSGCEIGEAAEDAGPTLLTVEAVLGDLLIRAEATGTVEPVRRVEVKSKASGEILRLLIDIGDVVERGRLLAEIDPRDVRNRFNQTEAGLHEEYQDRGKYHPEGIERVEQWGLATAGAALSERLWRHRKQHNRE